MTLTTCGWALYKLSDLVGTLSGTKASPENRLKDPLEVALADMKKFIGSLMLGHRARYQLLKREALVHDHDCPTPEEYDHSSNLPAAFEEGHEIDLHEITRICDDLDLDRSLISALIQRNPSLVVNYLRLDYWSRRSQPKSSSQEK